LAPSDEDDHQSPKREMWPGQGGHWAGGNACHGSSESHNTAPNRLQEREEELTCERGRSDREEIRITARTAGGVRKHRRAPRKDRTRGTDSRTEMIQELIVCVGLRFTIRNRFPIWYKNDTFLFETTASSIAIVSVSQYVSS